MFQISKNLQINLMLIEYHIPC